MTPEQLAQRLTPAAWKARRIQLLQDLLSNTEAHVKRRTPVRSGRLRRSITRQVIMPGLRGRVGTNLIYARAVHEGLKSYIIHPKAKKALFWKGAAHPVRKVKHPGIKANPYLTNGLNDAQAGNLALAQQAGAAFFGSVAGRTKQ